ncbi:three-helix bundle dimerization domain-containing protein [Naasia lichenicola]|uniref:three-helix bundle dimerization domain-containing protein n=1 Tax=Naasia lichenicola TaxID=2565933 RepID=UPI00130E19FB|nr:hypothetical protein [Naasia lichenicola]
MAPAFEADAVIRQVTNKLVIAYPDRSRDLIELRVRDEVRALEDSPVTAYIGIIAERRVRSRLRAG